MVVFWVTGLWLVEGRRGSGSATGDAERERGGEARRLVGSTFMESRCASSALRSLLAVVIGSRFATEAERCCTTGRSTGERESISTTLGRPACAYDTSTAMSQLFPFSHLDTDMVLALHSVVRSWTTTSS
jgi:hypothetical protein